MRTKRLLLTAAVSVFIAAAAYLSAQGASGQGDAFKLGTFSQAGRTFVGLVLRDTTVVDIAQANAEIAGTKATIPRDLKELIVRYEEGGLRQRLQAIAGAAAGASGGRPAYIHDVKSLKILPPVTPTTILNAAVNYVEHANEMARPAGGGAAPGAGAAPAAKPPESIPGLWQRKPGDIRHNPYLFIKPVAAITSDGEPIRLPPGRDRIDWECELNAVIGRTASHVPPERAGDYIFGYTLQNDVSDRGGRSDGRHGSDWLIGKGHDTFAPIGPFVVPREFIKDPQKLAIKFTLSGKLMQDSNTDRMTHTVFEMVSFASHILTLRPGDLVSTGSPAGVGTARATPIYMKAGDLSVCSIEGIGTLTNPVVGASAVTSSSGR